MSGATHLVTVDAFLSRPEYERCEYEAGVVTEKPMPNWMHGELCFWIMFLLARKFPEFKSAPEVRARLNPERWRLPDISVVPRSLARQRYSTDPLHLCIEVMSEDDTDEELFAKSRLHNEWGVPYCWVIDGAQRKAWEVHRGTAKPKLAAQVVTAGEIQLSVDRIFSCLDDGFMPGDSGE